MIDVEELRDCYTKTPSKMVLLVADGLGGLAHPDTGKSELETGHTPNLDALAQKSACGLTTPVLPGVAPGSGPGHLALFGYDPLKHQIGRGALEALGIEVELAPGDVAARGNFCTVDGDGLLTDRRAVRSQLPEGDRCLAENWNAAYERMALLQETLNVEITSWTSFAIQFPLIHPIVTSLIVGLNSPEQVDGILDAADGNYPDRAVFDQALDLFRKHGMVES